MNEDYELKRKAIGLRIRELRLAAGYGSYETFAVKYGFGRRNYWSLENGSNFKINTLLKIASVHKITLEEFFKGIE